MYLVSNMRKKNHVATAWGEGEWKRSIANSNIFEVSLEQCFHDAHTSMKPQTRCSCAELHDAHVWEGYYMTSYGTCMLCGVLSYFVSGVTFFFLFSFCVDDDSRQRKTEAINGQSSPSHVWLKVIGSSNLRGGGGELGTNKNFDPRLQLVCTKLKLKHAI